MPLKDYGVLKGHPVEGKSGTPHSPHYQIHVVDQQNSTDYRVAINVLSQVRPYNLLYQVINNFTYPTTATLLQLASGFTHVPSQPNGLAIDFLRSDIVDPAHMQPLRFTEVGSETQLNDILDTQVQEAIADPNAFICAFGERWGPEENIPDQYFDFTPGNGMHNIHMNQGNDPEHEQEDGVWQDGALLIYLPTKNQWMAVFLKFQSQASQTDDTTGHAL
ncbi:hypothetical protein KDA_19150 [Dictyobacter alpinus]|uniref:DUF2278 domain-containing protein n=1 Tax=Dictyobacter alpinus TaxID=2014873 RepID=A0A402B507_9CHLR|nr:YukJ family protein [Dictyobacter alpinus]GCE26431.1 hypothetical protein KDA_19150 [Dictyobacter alpinus]